MGFLDGIAGEVLGKVLNNNSQDGLSGIISMASSLIENSGGLSGLVQKFQDAGLGEQVASWISSNSNLPINENIKSRKPLHVSTQRYKLQIFK